MEHTSAASLEVAVSVKLAPWGLSSERRGPRRVAIMQTARAARTSGIGVGGCYEKKSSVCTVSNSECVEGVLFQRIQRAGWNLDVAARERAARLAAQEKSYEDDAVSIGKDKAIARAMDELSPVEMARLMRLSLAFGMRG